MLITLVVFGVMLIKNPHSPIIQTFFEAYLLTWIGCFLIGSFLFIIGSLGLLEN